jgi:hypothetical protein
MRRGIVRFLLATTAGMAAAMAAAQFTQGNLVISIVGDGSGALGSAATPVFLREVTPSGVQVGSELAMPTSVVGLNRILTNSGSATSEGALTRSVDGRYLVLAGYDAAVGTASVAGTTSATVNRIVGRVDFTKTSAGIDTTTRMNDAYSGNNIRSATTVDGSRFWTGGAGTGVGGAWTTLLGNTGASTQLNSTVVNVRNVNVAGGQLYVSSAAGTNVGVNTVGSGLPTNSGQPITVLFGSTSGTGTPSPYDYVFFDLNGSVPGLDACFVADDRSVANGGGIQRWNFDGTNWTLAYTLNGGLTGGARGLCGAEALGVVTLYATTSETTTRLVRFDNAQLPGGTAVALASAPTNRAFRGVDFAPVSGNQSPNIDPFTVPGASEGAAFTLDFDATDPDGPGATWSLANQPAGMTINPATGVVSWTPSETQGGQTFTGIQVTVADGAGGFDTETWSVTVDETNEVPVISNPSVPGASEGQPFTVDFDATDADIPAQTLTFSLIGAPAGMTINATTGVISWTPSETQGGQTFNFTVRVTDDFAPPASADRAVSVTVTETNQAPVLGAIGNQSGQVNTLITFTATATDSDIPAQNLTFSLANNPPAGASINPTTGVFTWTPTTTGSFTFDVVVSDDFDPAASDAETITIQVTSSVPALLGGAPVDLVGRFFSPNGSALVRTTSGVGGFVVEPTGVNEGTFTPYSDAFKQPVPFANANLLGRAFQFELELSGWNGGAASLVVQAGQGTGGAELSVTSNGTSFTFGVPGGTETDASTATNYRVTTTIDGAGLATTVVTRLNGNQANTSLTFGAYATTGLDQSFFQATIAGSATSKGAAVISTFTTTALDNVLWLFSADPYTRDGLNRNVVLGQANLTTGVRGYQAFLSALGMTFQSGTYTDTPYPVKIIDPITGDLNLAAGINLGDAPITANATLAELVFSASAANPFVGFRANNPPTRFSRGVNGSLAPTVRPSNTLIFESILPTIQGLDARQGGGNLFQGGSLQQGPLTIRCEAFDGGSLQSGLRGRPSIVIDFQPLGNNGTEDVTLDVFAESGATFVGVTTIDGNTPTGTANVIFTAIDDSGNERTVTAALDVAPIQVTVNLSATALGGTNVVRAVEFSIGGTGGGSAPINIVRDVTFNGGSATVVFTSADGLVPNTNYTRISAKDPKHTLRKLEPLVDGGGQQYTATIVMKSGDASNDNIIDIVDYGIVVSQFGQNVGQNTPDGFVGFHSDFTGNGLVQSNDVTVVTNVGQFLSLGEGLPGSVNRPDRAPRKVVSVKELYAEGVRVAESMDLNRDGWVTVEEITGWLTKGKAAR